MIPLEYEISRLKTIFLEMLELTKKQITSTKDALIYDDNEMAAEIIRKERRLNAYEITIDRECEDIIALHTPLASDLRLIIAILKMSGILERIGDHAYNICNFIYNDKLTISKEIIDGINVEQIFEGLGYMMDNISDSLIKEDVRIARRVFKQDKLLNKINKNAPFFLEKYCEKHPKEKISNIILISRTIGKLERAGDLLKNMSEEIIFYIELEVVKHKKRDKKIRKLFNIHGFNK